MNSLDIHRACLKMIQQLQGRNSKGGSYDNQLITEKYASSASSNPNLMPITVFPRITTPLQLRIRINNLHKCPEYYHTLYEERAAIYEYDAGMEQEVAEDKARNDILNLWLEHEYLLSGFSGVPTTEFKLQHYERGMRELQCFNL